MLLLQEQREVMDIGDRIRRIVPFWNGLSGEERLRVMTLSVADAKAQARKCSKDAQKKADGGLHHFYLLGFPLLWVADVFLTLLRRALLSEVWLDACIAVGNCRLDSLQ